MPLGDVDFARWACGDGSFGANEWRLNVQSFAPGGFEATCVRVSRDRVCNMLMQRPVGRRAGDKHRSDAGREFSAQRARKRVRHLCKNIRADHLLTLTTREQKNDLDGMLVRWQKFVRLYRQEIGNDAWEYVATVERHPTNPDHLHLHVACTGRIDVSAARRCWLEALGGVGGNIDARYIRARSDDLRVLRIAKYLAKYVGKALDVGGFNRRKYWPSRVDLPALRRYLLPVHNVRDALAELSSRFGLSIDETLHKGHFFWFPSGEGFWLEFVPSMDAPPPF